MILYLFHLYDNNTQATFTPTPSQPHRNLTSHLIYPWPTFSIYTNSIQRIWCLFYPSLLSPIVQNISPRCKQVAPEQSPQGLRGDARLPSPPDGEARKMQIGNYFLHIIARRRPQSPLFRLTCPQPPPPPPWDTLTESEFCPPAESQCWWRSRPSASTAWAGSKPKSGANALIFRPSCIFAWTEFSSRYQKVYCVPINWCSGFEERIWKWSNFLLCFGCQHFCQHSCSMGWELFLMRGNIFAGDKVFLIEHRKLLL